MHQTMRDGLYENDFALWVEQQIAALGDGRLRDLDIEHLSEEILALAKRDRRELISRLTVLVTHLLKLRYQPDRASTSWVATIVEQAGQIQLILNDSPSLRPELREFLHQAYLDGRRAAAAQTNLPLEHFPHASPPDFAASIDLALAGEDFGGHDAVKNASQRS